MCVVPQLRVSVHERISVAAEDFLLQMEKDEESAQVPALRALLNQRLAAAAEEIVGLFAETVAEYEDRVQRSEREICRQRTLLDAVLKQPVVRLHRAVCPADVQQLLVNTEGTLTKHQELNTIVHQDDPKPPHIKKEQEELWIKQGGEHPERPEETGFTPVPVKSEDEEKPPSSHLHETGTVDQREDCGGSEPARNSGPDGHFSPASDNSTETDESDGDWTTSCEAHLGTEVVKNTEAPGAEVGKSVKQRPFPCSHCGKRFIREGNLNRHIRDHMCERLFPCTSCDKSFKDSWSLTAHMRCHTGEKPFTCRVCNKSFSVKGHLNRHMAYHTEGGAHNCSVCGKNFRDRGDAARHMRIHTGEKPFTCAVCNKRFYAKEQFNRHMRIHTGEKLLSCSVCGKGFTITGNLKTHMRIHTGERPFTCRVCNRSFYVKGNFNRHMRHHTGEKPYSCSVCGKNFSGRANMKRHMIIHTGEKPFTCAVCNKNFRLKGHLNVHMRYHTGEKPYSCSVCGKCFTVTGNLRQHMKLHVGECKATESAETAESGKAEVDTDEPLKAS